MAYVLGGYCLEECKLTAQSLSVTVEAQLNIV